MKIKFEITTKKRKNIDKISEFIRNVCVDEYQVGFISNHTSIDEKEDFAVARGELKISLDDSKLTFKILKQKVEEFIRIYSLDVIFDMYKM